MSALQNQFYVYCVQLSAGHFELNLTTPVHTPLLRIPRHLHCNLISILAVFNCLQATLSSTLPPQCIHLCCTSQNVCTAILFLFWLFSTVCRPLWARPYHPSAYAFAAHPKTFALQSYLYSGFFQLSAGHYELNLTTPVHQAFAVRLKDVAYGEPNEGFNWYNVVYDMYSHAIKVGFKEKWIMFACCRSYLESGLQLVQQCKWHVLSSHQN